MKKVSIILVTATIIIMALFLCSCGEKSDFDRAVKELDGYNISMSYYPHRVDASQEVVYKNRTENAFNEIWFNAYANAYRESASMSPVSEENKEKVFRKGESFGGFTVQNVKADQKPAEFYITDTLFKVMLPKALYPGESVTVSFDYTVILANAWHRLGYGDNTVNLGNMIPLVCAVKNGAFTEYPYYCYGDPFVSDLANFNVTFIAPKKYVVAATGERLSKENAEDGIKYSYSANGVRDFALMMSEKFILMSEKINNIEVNYYYFKDTNPSKSLKCAVDAIKTYSELFGGYPYSQLSVVQADFHPGGMEYPQLVIVSADTISENIFSVIAHETAHQWWYGLVGNNQVTDAWMDEGLAEFSTMLFMKKNPLYGNYDEMIKEAHNLYKLYIDITLNYKKNIDTSMNRPLGSYANGQEYGYMCYLKSMLMFESLYNIMGEKRFLKGLNIYYSENIYKIADPDNLIAAFSKAYKSSLKTWFDGWTEGKNT